MIAIWVKVKVKADRRGDFLKAIEVDALGSEGDEPGCARFNVLQDGQDPNTYYFYEVYKDEAALEAHRAAPHYAVWRAAADTLDGPAQATRCTTVFPAATDYWFKAEPTLSGDSCDGRRRNGSALGTFRCCRAAGSQRAEAG
jgi:quinol monooxygenase YgiN